ncbi:MAG: RluA family pseudouridine synthase [Oscillospiraceae bacterium]|jgi:23S rRNA pseudouridine1911/1915/1917 synthase|nr:RluA family pseudouridine synthase [Oscillospiraceae bacterium]
MTELTFPVLPEEDGRLIKHVLRARGVSVRLANSLKRVPGGMRLNGGSVARTVDPVKAGDVLTLCIPGDETVPEPIACALDIVYEDGDVLVVDKPPTLPMHPSHNHQGDTLANAVSAYLAGKGRQAAFRSAGRLDKGTSGLVVCCLHSYAASKLNGRVEKAYCALAHGEYHGAGVFENAIYRPFPNRTLRACRDYADPREPGDESAVTHWEALAYHPNEPAGSPGTPIYHPNEPAGSRDGVTLLRVWLETGRTHQIRAHFAHHGTPLLGDDYYGAPPREEPGHFLHCGEVKFIHPVTGEELRFHTGLPERFVKLTKPFPFIEKR